MISETDFLLWLKSKGLADRTLKEYTLYYKRFEKYAENGEISQQVFDAFLGDVPLHMARCFIRNIKQYLIIRGMNENLPPEQMNYIHNLYIGKGKLKPPKPPEIVNPDDIVKISSAMKSEASRLMLSITFWCGLRARELLNLTWNNFNWREWRQTPNRNGVVTFVGKGNKTRKVPVPPQTMIRLRTWVKANWDKKIFDKNKPIFPITYDRWKLLLGRASVRGIGRHIPSHALRHSISMYLMEHDWKIEELKEFLGHSSIETTQRYAHVSQKKIDDLYSKIVGSESKSESENKIEEDINSQQSNSENLES